MSNRYFFAALAVFIAFFVLRPYFWSSDEKLIRQVVEDVSSAISFESRLKPVETLSRFGEINKKLHPQIKGEYHHEQYIRKIEGLEKIKELALLASRTVYKNRVQNLGSEVKITENTARLRGDFLVEGQKSEGEYKRLFELHFGFEKLDGDWKIKSIQAREKAGEQEP